MNNFPAWIKKRLVQSETAFMVEGLIDRFNLHTVCKSACCPNKSECLSNGKVTFMILGDICTRECNFCAVKKGPPLPVDAEEPGRLSYIIKILGLRHIVITSVTRDDLNDCGANQFCKAAEEIKKKNPGVTIEALVPDFKGVEEFINMVADSPIDIFSHNIETIPRLYNTARPRADYKRSLNVLKTAKKSKKITKSGIMVGLGEKRDEVYKTMHDLRDAGCELLTIGQYLQPTKRQLEVYEFVHPKVFDLYRNKGFSLGFKDVLSEPFARTSYMESESYFTMC